MATSDHEYAGISWFFCFLVTQHVIPLYSEYNHKKTLPLAAPKLLCPDSVCVFFFHLFSESGILTLGTGACFSPSPCRQNLLPRSLRLVMPLVMVRRRSGRHVRRNGDVPTAAVADRRALDCASSSASSSGHLRTYPG